jgi:hypothetical protein
MPLAALPVARLGRFESADGLPGRAVAADRALSWNVLVKCVVMLLLDAEVTAPSDPGAAVFPSKHDRPGADPGPCCGKAGRSAWPGHRKGT